MMIYKGIKIQANSLMEARKVRIQFRIPKSKRKRIRLKFKKDKRNWKWIEKEYMLLDRSTNIVYVSLQAYNLLIQNIKENEEFCLHQW